MFIKTLRYLYRFIYTNNGVQIFHLDNLHNINSINFSDNWRSKMLKNIIQKGDCSYAECYVNLQNRWNQTL